LLSTAPKTRKPASRYLEGVNLAIDRIVARPDRPVRLKELARAAGFSPFHFHRVFQALVGETPGDFSRRLRLERALAMMAFQPRESFTSIALSCGFNSSSDFSRAFRQRFGVAPSKFDIADRRQRNQPRMEAFAPAGSLRLAGLPRGANPDAFRARLRTFPPRTVAYIRVANPYQGDAVFRAAERLVRWAERHGFADSQWLGYQWENPELVPLEQCRYHVAVEADSFSPRGEIGRYRFPAMTVAEVEVRGGIDLEIRALQWLYGTWLPRSGYVPSDQPAFEAWIGRPFAHGIARFELRVWLPVKRV